MNAAPVNIGEVATVEHYNNLIQDLLNANADQLTDAGATANLYEVTVNDEVASIGAGFWVKFYTARANTGSVDVKFTGAGLSGSPVTKDLKYFDGTELENGAIPAGAEVVAIYNGTYLQLLTATPKVLRIDQTYTASEALSANKPVSTIAVADQVELTVRHNLDNPGAQADFTSGTATRVRSCKAGNAKLVHFYRESSAWKIIVGTVDPETLAVTYGSAVEVNANSSDELGDVAYIEDDKVACIWSDSSGDLEVAVVTISGTTPTVGTSQTVYSHATNTANGSALALVDTNKLAISYLLSTGSLVVLGATISGATITLDTANAQTTAGFYNATGADQVIDAAKAATDKVFVAARSSTGTGLGIAASFSGTVPTMGSSSAFETGTGVTGISVEQISSNSLFIAWDDSSGTPASSCRRATLSTLTISYDTAVDFDSNKTEGTSRGQLNQVLVLSSTRAFVLRKKTSDNYAYLNEVVMESGTFYIQKDFSVYASTASSLSICLLYGTRSRFFLTYNSGGLGKCYEEYDNSDSYIGFTTASAAASASVSVRVNGPLSGFSGLTAGDRLHLPFTSTTLTTTNTGVCVGVVKDTDELYIELQRKHYSKTVVSFRVEQASTGYQKFYHNLGRIPQTIRVYASLQDDNEGVGYLMRKCRGYAKSTSEYGSMTETDGTGYVNSSLGRSSNFLDCSSSVANPNSIDAFMVQLNFTTHDSGNMSSSGMYLTLEFE